jgi:hypothetical protein
LTPVVELPPQEVHTFLGVYQEQLVFLDHDLWICSLKLDDTDVKTAGDIVKHIFIPPEFVGGTTVAKPLVTHHGSLVFSKEDKLAIIKGALDWSFT